MITLKRLFYGATFLLAFFSIAVIAHANQPTDPEPEYIFIDPFVELQVVDLDGDGVASGTISLFRNEGDFDGSPVGSYEPYCNYPGITQYRVRVPTNDFGLAVLDAEGNPQSQYTFYAPECYPTTYPVELVATGNGEATVTAEIVRSGGVAAWETVVVKSQYEWSEETTEIVTRPAVVDLSVNDALAYITTRRPSMQLTNVNTGAIYPGSQPLCPDRDVVFLLNDPNLSNTNPVIIGPLNGRAPVPGGIRFYNAPCDVDLTVRLHAQQAGTSSNVLRSALVMPGVPTGPSNNIFTSFATVIATGTLNLTPPEVIITAPVAGAVYEGSVPAPEYACIDDPISFPELPVGSGCQQTGYAESLGDHTMTVTAKTFGGTTTKSVTYSVVATPPVITIAAPVNGSVYTLSEIAAVIPDYACTDDESAVSECSAGGFSTELGTHTMTVTGTSAGGTATASVTYDVVPDIVPSDFGPGFGGPIDMEAVNTGKASQAFPIFFNVYQDGVEITDPAVIDLTVSPVQCEALSSMGTSPVEETYADPVELRYVDGKFKAKLQIGREGVGCYALKAYMIDGSGSITAYFNLS